MTWLIKTKESREFINRGGWVINYQLIHTFPQSSVDRNSFTTSHELLYRTLISPFSFVPLLFITIHNYVFKTWNKQPTVVLVSIQVQASSNNKNSSNFVAIPSQNYNNRIINPLLVKEIKKKNHAILILSSRTRVSHLYTKSGGIVSGRRGEGGWGWKGNGRVYVFFVTCDSKNALECLSSGVKYLCSDRLYFVFDRRRGSRLPAILTVYRYTEKYIYI